MKILIVDDEEAARYGMKKTLAETASVIEAAGLEAAREKLGKESPDVVLLDLNLGDEDGFDLLDELVRSPDAPPTVIITAHGDERIAVDALKRGAFDYLAKPFEIDELRLVVRNAGEQAALRDENRRLKSDLAAATGYGEIVGRSDSMMKVFGMIEKVAETDVTVLLSGESGSGKELVAREIHHRSPRANADLVTVNCAAIPESLIESELFGHEKGAFTGAADRRRGKFEQAAGGTLFLDEIGDMPLETQSKILRVLEERRIERLGGDRSIPVDVRILSATHRDLRQMVEDGDFREDLYYRLEVVRIHIPPLRRRPEDIPLLIATFQQQFGSRHGRELEDIRPAALKLLLNYAYPGNVRQLRNIIERLVVLAEDGIIDESDLPEEIRFFDPASGTDTSGPSLEPLLGMDYKGAREAFETKYLLSRLRDHDNNITHTAEAIGIHRQSLQQKIKDLGLRRHMEG